MAKPHGRAPERSRLGREISVVLVFKLAALFIIWLLFFGPAHRVQVTADSARQVILEAPAAAPASDRSQE